jgi:hypothetical protein
MPSALDSARVHLGNVGLIAGRAASDVIVLQDE